MPTNKISRSWSRAATRFAVSLSFVGILASGVHCSSSDADPSADTSGDEALSSSKLKSLCSSFWDQRCTEYLTCQPDGFAAEFNSHDDCVAEKGAACVRSYTSPAIKLKSKDVATCFDAYGTLTCQNLTRFINEANPAMPAACAPLLHGSRADGAACAYDAECTGGRCNVSGECGVCATRLAAGGTCSADTDCSPGLHCGTDGKCATPTDVGQDCTVVGCFNDLLCEGGKCGAYHADGAACDASSGNDECSWPNNRTCSSTQGTCQVSTIHQIGEPCGYEIVGGKFHDRGSCAPHQRCAENAIRAFCVPEKHVGEGCFFGPGPATDSGECDSASKCVDSKCVANTASACTAYKAPAVATGPNPGGLPILLNGGGLTIHHVNLTTVTFAGYPYTDHVRALDDYSLSSGWLAQVGAEYGVTGGVHLPSVELSDALPATVTNEDIQDFLVKKIKDGTLPTPTPFSPDDGYYYMLYIPKTVVVSGPPDGTTCVNISAYHDVVAYPYQFAYAVVANCPTVEGFSETQLIDISAPHELLEGTSDSGLDMSAAWYAPSTQLGRTWAAAFGGEATDFCTSNSKQEGDFLMPRSWSNANAAAGSDPCLPHLDGEPPYFNMTSTALTASGAPGTTVTIPLTAWSSGTRGSWALDSRAYGGTLTLPTGAVTFDKPTVNTGDVSTVSVAIPATATSGTYTVVSVRSSEPGATPPVIIRHEWPVTIIAK